MKRKRADGITPFKDWETTNPNGIEKRYIRLGNSLMLHPKFMHLSPLAVKLFINMKLESAGEQIFEYPHSKFKAIASKGGFSKVRKELEKAGFIRTYFSGKHLKQPNKYIFTGEWKKDETVKKTNS